MTRERGPSVSKYGVCKEEHRLDATVPALWPITTCALIVRALAPRGDVCSVFTDAKMPAYVNKAVRADDPTYYWPTRRTIHP